MMFGPPPTLSPGQMTAPPVKKQRGGPTPERDPITMETDGAIAQRRAELLRLQQASGTDALLDRARNQLQSAGRGPPPTRPTMGMGVPPRGGPPPPGPPIPRPEPGLAQVRRSDIFPSVPKSTSVVLPPHQPPPPAPSVARRLEGSFSTGAPLASALRSKSAPPIRPPPPPVPLRPPSEAPASRGATTRPPPTTPKPPPPPVMTKPAAPPEEEAPVPEPVVSPAKDEPVVSDVEEEDDDITPPSSNTTSMFPVENEGVETTKTDSNPTPFQVRFASVSPGSTAPTPTPFLNSFSSTSPKGVAPAPTPFPGKLNRHAKEDAATPPGAEESPRFGGTPFYASGTPNSTESGSTSPTLSSGKPRKDLLRTMRAHADTPPHGKPPGPPPFADEIKPSPELRLQQELVRAEKEKKNALKRVSDLEEKLHHATSPQPTKHVGFMSPVETLLHSPGGSVRSGLAAMGLSPMGQAPSRRRVPTPHPKRNVQENDEEHLKEAVQCVPFEYESEIGTFIVRRPFGLSTERELWFGAGQLPNKLYEKNANVKDVSTLELVVKIKADDSLFALHGASNVRHQSSSDAEWKEYGSADDGEMPLGSILYIDKEANEMEYSLDEIFEGAIAVRNHYCASIISAADGFRVYKEKTPRYGSADPSIMLAPQEQQLHQQQQQQQQQTASKPITRDASVGTEELAPIADKQQQEPDKLEKKQPLPAPPLPDDDGGSDVLSVFIGMFFSFIFGTIWTVFVRTPLRIISFALTMALAAIVLSLIWLYYIADDHGAKAMGATMDLFYFNRPGIV